jgi:hypothetical protein
LIKTLNSINEKANNINAVSDEPSNYMELYNLYLEILKFKAYENIFAVMYSGEKGFDTVAYNED